MTDPLSLALVPAFFLLCALLGAAVCPRSPRGSDTGTQVAIGFVLLVALSVVPLSFSLGFDAVGPATTLCAMYGLTRIELALPRSRFGIAFLAATALNIALLTVGTALNPGLGDHDPYEHAMAVSYIYETGSIYPHGDVWRYFGTLDPYPPGYDAAAAVVSAFTLSVANGLRIWAVLCAGIFPFAVRFWARSAGLSSSTASLAGTVVCLLPSAPTHFAWTHTLGVSLALISAATFINAAKGGRWAVTGGVALAAFGLSATSDLLYAPLLFLPAVTPLVKNRPVKPVAGIVLITLVATSGWGLHLWERFSGRPESTLLTMMDPSHLSVRTYHDEPREPRSMFKEHTGNARPYAVWEFFHPPFPNYFNIPVGLPAAATVAGLLGFWLWRRRKKNLWPGLFLFATMVAVHGERLPFEFFPHRAWSYLAVFTATGCALCWRYRTDIPDRLKRAAPLFYLLAVLTFGYSAWQRGHMEWYPWGGEIMITEGQKETYYTMGTVVKNEKVFPLAGGARYGYVPAFGGRTPFWGEAEQMAEKAVKEQRYGDAAELLREAGYRWLVLDSTIDLQSGTGAGDAAYEVLSARRDLAPVIVKPGAALFRFVRNATP